MPYYKAGDYYQGDYYQGDFLGIGKALKGGAKALVGGIKAVTGVIGGSGIPVVSSAAKVVNKLATVASGAFGGGVGPTITTSGPTPYITPMISLADLRPPPGPGSVPVPGIGGAISRLLPGGSTGYYTRRHMNVTNVKALRRAGRRVKGFLRIAQRLGALPVNRGKGKRLFKRKSR